MKKVLVGLFTLIAMLNLVSVATYAANGNLPGDGTAQNPYLIEDCSDMVEFAHFENAPKYWSTGVYTSLAADIDMTYCIEYGYFFAALVAEHSNLQLGNNQSYGVGINEVITDSVIPLITNDGIIYLPAISYNGRVYTDRKTHQDVSGYSGIFDGAGFAIRNFGITTEDGYYNSYCGIFGRVNQEGIVRNLIVDDTSIVVGYCASGGICGENNGVIENCVVSGDITYGTAIGGIAGVNKGLILNCSFTGLVQARNDAGGIAGINYGQIDQCCVNAKIRAKSYAGGIAGINGDYENNIEGYIDNSYALGSVYANMGVMCFDHYGAYRDDCWVFTVVDNHYAGGITALNVTGSVKGCYCSVYNNDGDAYLSSFAYTGLTGRELNGSTESSFSENSEPDYLTKLTYDEMASASTWLGAGWDNIAIWTIADLTYPALINTSLADNWADLVIEVTEPETSSVPDKFTVEVESGMKVFSYGNATPIVAKLLNNDVEVEGDYTVTWEIVNVGNTTGLSDCFYIEDGVLYNTNESGLDRGLSLTAYITYDGHIYEKKYSVTLLAKVVTRSLIALKAEVKSSRDRVNPKDSIYITMSNLGYSEDIAEDTERDTTITVEVFEKDNPLFVPVVRIFDIEESLYQNRFDQTLSVNNLKVISQNKDYIKFDRRHNNIYSKATLCLKDLDLTGMTNGFTVRISNSHFSTEVTAIDNSSYSSKGSITPGDINGKRTIPMNLCDGIVTTEQIDKVKVRVSNQKRKGYVSLSGSFTLSELDSLLNNGLAIAYGETSTLCINRDRLFFRDGDKNVYDFNLDAPVVSEAKDGIYTMNFSCSSDGVMTRRDRAEKVLSVKAVFNSRTHKYSLKIYNIITADETDSESNIQFNLAPFTDGVVDPHIFGKLADGSTILYGG